MKKEEAAVRVVFEDRRNEIRHDLEGECAAVFMSETDGLSVMLAGEASQKDVIAAIALGTADIIKTMAKDTDKAKEIGIIFVRAFGHAMKKITPDPSINLWEDIKE